MACVSKVAARPTGSGNSVVPLAGDAVQRLAPPVVGRHIQAGNGARLVDELGGLFFQRHALHQVGGALLRRKAGVEPCGLLGILRHCHRTANRSSSNAAAASLK